LLHLPQQKGRWLPRGFKDMGIRATYKEARKKWHWPRLAAFIEAVARRLPRPLRGKPQKWALDLSKKDEIE
jgi:hypothetical protein